MTKTVIMHLSANCYPPLPANHHTKNIWQQLSVGVDEYHVVARSLDNKYSYSQQGNIYLHLLPKIGNSAFYFMLTSWIILLLIPKYKVTHIIAQSPVVGGFTAAVLSFFYKFRLFIEIHGVMYFSGIQKGNWHFRFYRLVSSFSFKRAQCIRVLSTSMLDDIERVYGLDNRKKSVVVSVRVDKKVFSVFKASYKLSSQRQLKLVTVGAFNSVKNHLQLIENLSKFNFPVSLVIIGNHGPLKEKCIALAKSLNVELLIKENISQNEISHLLIDQDIYIHYSIAEGTPRAILEAMMVGLPVISTDVGYVKDIIQSESTGLLLSDFTHQALNSALIRLQDEALRQRFGLAARHYVLENYEAEVDFKKYRNAILGQ